jgi:hypothetical protein
MLSPLQLACGNRSADAFNVSNRQRRMTVRRVPALEQLEHDDRIDAASEQMAGETR